MTDVCVSHVRWGRRVPLLRNASFDLAAGEIAAVVGSARDGRSALLQVVAGLMRPDSGEVRFTDATAASLSYTEPWDLLGNQILWIDPISPPDHLLVRDHIVMSLILGCRYRYKVRAAERLAWEALDQMGIADYGENHLIAMSRWELLLIELARSVAVRPRFVLIDDLFDGFGPRRTREAGRLLRSLVDELECGVLLGVLDVESASVADHVWCLDRGSLTTIDRPSDHQDVALASEMHERGDKDIAAFVAGRTLEEHLRKLAVKSGIPTERTRGVPCKADALNGALANIGVYNWLQQKVVTALLDLRNKAAHGRSSEYDAAQVSAMIRDVRDFLTRFPA